VPLPYDEANRVIGAAHDRASQIGIRVTVAVVDEGGLLVALGRMNGAFPLSPQIAEAKAVSAALTQRDGGALADMNQQRPAFFQALTQMVRVPLIAGLGSIPIKRAGAVLGAVGVSGGKPEQDVECAEAGLRVLVG
jgi:uncharacterized protein GlcG (DUF336 family)